MAKRGGERTDDYPLPHSKYRLKVNEVRDSNCGVRFGQGSKFDRPGSKSFVQMAGPFLPHRANLNEERGPSFFPDLLVIGTADKSSELLSKVTSVRLPFKLSISASERKREREKERRCKTAGEREREKEGRERRRTKTPYGRDCRDRRKDRLRSQPLTSASVAAPQGIPLSLSLSLSLPSPFLPSWGPRTRILLEKKQMIESDVRVRVRLKVRTDRNRSNRVSGSRLARGRKAILHVKRGFRVRQGKQTDRPLSDLPSPRSLFLLVGNAQPAPRCQRCSVRVVGGLTNQRRVHSGLLTLDLTLTLSIEVGGPPTVAPTPRHSRSV